MHGLQTASRSPMSIPLSSIMLELFVEFDPQEMVAAINSSVGPNPRL
jgi:hypothetical protein